MVRVGDLVPNERPSTAPLRRCSTMGNLTVVKLDMTMTKDHHRARHQGDGFRFEMKKTRLNGGLMLKEQQELGFREVRKRLEWIRKDAVERCDAELPDRKSVRQVHAFPRPHPSHNGTFSSELEKSMEQSVKVKMQAFMEDLKRDDERRKQQKQMTNQQQDQDEQKLDQKKTNKRNKKDSNSKQNKVTRKGKFPEQQDVQELDGYTKQIGALALESKQYAAQADNLKHDLWYAEHYGNNLEYLVKLLRSENAEWRRKYEAASRNQYELNRAREEAKEHTVRLGKVKSQLKTCRELYDDTNEKLKKRDQELFKLRADLQEEKHRHSETVQVFTTETQNLQEELRLANLEIQKLQALQKSTQKSFKQYRTIVHQARQSLLEEDDYLVSKFSSVRRYRQENPHPINKFNL